jgi:hypothetical protein
VLEDVAENGTIFDNQEMTVQYIIELREWACYCYLNRSSKERNLMEKILKGNKKTRKEGKSEDKVGEKPERR